MIELILFLVGSVLSTWYSIPSLRKPGSHGYFRFFAWEIILGLFVLNMRAWFVQPFAWYQVISWILLILSLVPLVAGIISLVSMGKPGKNFEATTQLVTSGIYRLIRHPLYTSLILLTWGIFFKSPSILNGCLGLVGTTFLYATARADESECLVKFGQEYAGYMKISRMFIPFIY